MWWFGSGEFGNGGFDCGGFGCGVFHSHYENSLVQCKYHYILFKKSLNG